MALDDISTNIIISLDYILFINKFLKLKGDK